MSDATASMFVDRRPEPAKSGLPWILTVGALFTGMVLARAIDWRGHAHPRI